MVTPRQCAVLLGLGLDPRDVEAERAVPGTFAAMLPRIPHVQKAFANAVAHVREVLANVRAIGAWVPSRRADTYAPIDLEIVACAARRSRVLVFLTHHDVGLGLQLGAHMVPLPTIIEAIGKDYDGVIDLGACETKVDVAALLRASCPHARCLLYGGLHRLEVRASIIRAVQRCLLAERRPYINVATDALVEMAIQSRIWSGDHE